MANINQQLIEKHIIIIGECQSNTCLYINNIKWVIDNEINYELLQRLALSLHSFSKSFVKEGNQPSFHKLTLSKRSVISRRSKTVEILEDLYSAQIEHYIIVVLTSHSVDDYTMKESLEKELSIFIQKNKDILIQLQPKFDEYSKSQIQANMSQTKMIEEFLPLFKSYSLSVLI
ncbi:hypothetical protein EDI_138710 [Entamoeba dispar SAW760]|uniref:Uncharacterized protein n=1 Tax=Entamoeba dispar (strain ATCC PRA-260 / SAW760) TaxID=370354 RepID=B0EIG4_ENTDS|nr:uncharacterized protein EDI_138710 [Entamoeba dispar SAW760]EDR25693.1 hypothetical protein EDI_138710 [Entamoeba dispar SAW760]|eukprot:EDR25693.1 hypothetical protein EDI_138710 [Entamoeba dispar SAW760]